MSSIFCCSPTVYPISISPFSHLDSLLLRNSSSWPSPVQQQWPPPTPSRLAAPRIHLAPSSPVALPHRRVVAPLSTTGPRRLGHRSSYDEPHRLGGHVPSGDGQLDAGEEQQHATHPPLRSPNTRREEEEERMDEEQATRWASASVVNGEAGSGGSSSRPRRAEGSSAQKLEESTGMCGPLPVVTGVRRKAARRA
jgi:hypothetical protein